MIVNNQKTLLVTIELNKKDIEKLMKGRTINSFASRSETKMYLRVYCSDPEEFDSIDNE